MLDELTDEQLREKALDALTERLGHTQTFRFLSWLRNNPRDYQAWRDVRFKNLGVDELITQLKTQESSKPNLPRPEEG